MQFQEFLLFSKHHKLGTKRKPFGRILMKNLLNCYSLIFCNYFFLNYFLLTFLGDNFFFFDKSYFRFCFYFISEKWLYRLPRGFVICHVTRINITKEVLLYTEIMLLIICLSINVTGGIQQNWTF